MIYLDNAATTHPEPEVIEAVAAAMASGAGNASAVHRAGVQASLLVERARVAIAGRLGADPAGLLFTSGGTEANNLAILGVAQAGGRARGHLLCSAIEHPSVLEPMEHLAQQGFELEVLPVDGEGRLAPDMLRRALRPDTVLVSVIHSSNELGTVQDAASLAEICAAAARTPAPGRLPELHQGAPRSLRGARDPGVHQRPQDPRPPGGRRPVGAAGHPPRPRGARRPGAGPALGNPEHHRHRRLRGRGGPGHPRAHRPGDRAPGPPRGRAPGAPALGAHLRSTRTYAASRPERGLPGRHGQGSVHGPQPASLGSACSAGSTAPSAVLTAAGVSPALARATLRISPSHHTTRADLDALLEALVELTQPGATPA